MTDPFQPIQRLQPSPWLRRRIVDDQGGVCLVCRRVLEDWEIDHVVPLALGGGNERTNLVALCVDGHGQKTKRDLARVAKAERQRLHHKTGRSRRTPLQAFAKNLRKRLDGIVVPRETRDAADTPDA